MSHSLSSSTQRKKRLKTLQESLNRCRLDLALKKIKTAREVLSFLGVPHERFPSIALDEPLTINGYTQHIAFPLEDSLREKLKKEADDERNNNSPDSIVSGSVNTNTGSTLLREPGVDESKSHTPPSPELIAPPDQAGLPELEAKYPVTLFKFQTKAVRELKHKLLVREHRAALLQAGVGTGKTFIYGALLAELWQTGYFEGKTFSPWPALVITKASIIEQTRRVLETHFKLCPKRQFRVLNYDALRSGKGLDTVMELKKEVINGEPVKAYKWKKFLHPLVVIIDECQSAKNEESTQSQIIQNLSEVDDPNLKIVFSSATPFTRVSEAKYFCVNLKMQYTL